MRIADVEQPLSPEKARKWLLSTGRAEESDNALIPVEADDHLTLAGIQIAMSEEAALLSQVYVDVSPNVPHISPTILANISTIALKS